MKKVEKSEYEYIKNNYLNGNECFYLYDLSIIKNNIENITKYLPNNFSLYYAMKANSNKDILKFIKSVDGISGFEIASSGEYSKASKICSNNEIIYTGPAKTIKDLENVITKKIKLINVESVVEAIRIDNIAKKCGRKKVNILLRINVNYKIEEAAENMGGISTKMGIDESAYLESYDYIKKLEHINIVGIHVFSASGILDYKANIKYARYVFELVKKLKQMNHKVDIIDLGGGFGVDYTGKNLEFDTKKYFVDLKKLINEYSFNDIKFILELGCYITASSGYYFSEIIDIKESKGYKHIVLKGGLNHIPTATLNGKHPFYIIKMGERKLYKNQPKVKNEKVDIDGPLCTAEDKVLWDVYVKEANIGDIVVIKQAGAYCYDAAWLKFLSHNLPLEIIKEETNYYNSSHE